MNFVSERPVSAGLTAAALPQWRIGQQTIIQGDCLVELARMKAHSVDVVLTSPPYNIGKKYDVYNDNLPAAEYLAWITAVGGEVKRVLRPLGSFFLVIGRTPTLPWIDRDVGNALRGLFVLQNPIVWVKAWSDEIDSPMAGQHSPCSSPRYLTQTDETIYHFTHRGSVPLDKLAIGVPFADKSNIERRGHAGDLRPGCNIWRIPHTTVQSNDDRFGHRATFPEELVERCITLHGLREGPVVLDPFVGIGTTLLVTQRLGLEGIGIELSPNYAATAVQRLRGGE